MEWFSKSSGNKRSVPDILETGMEFVEPVFRYLSDPSLLKKKCLHKKHNPNESINNVIWNRILKTGFVDGFATYVDTFNCGQITKRMVVSKLHADVGKITVAAMTNRQQEAAQLLPEYSGAQEKSKAGEQTG